MEFTDVRISVSKELAEHYRKVLDLRDGILEDEDSEDKSRISVLNATTSIIKELAKIQSDLYNAERFAILQQIIVKTLKESNKEIAEKVIRDLEDQYEKTI